MDYLLRSRMLLGEDKIVKLRNASVALFGLGGVGGGALEALARLGIGEFHLIDNDEFSLSNLNRQILSTRENIGVKKVEAAKERILSINPDAKVYLYPMFYLPGQGEDIDFARFDFVVDCIDTVSAKKDIIKRCHENQIGIVSVMGCGNRLDPRKLTTCDIFETKGDPLSKIMRKACREMGIPSLRVVCSLEEPLTPLFKEESPSPTRRDVPGSISLVPPVAGYLAAYEAMEYLLKI